eukprot:422169-Pelagomonas_calceolata.AAC.3
MDLTVFILGKAVKLAQIHVVLDLPVLPPTYYTALAVPQSCTFALSFAPDQIRYFERALGTLQCHGAKAH